MGSKYIMSSIQPNVKIKGIREIYPWKKVVAIKMTRKHFIQIQNHPRMMVPMALV